MKTVLITPPTEELISLDRAKEQCRVEHDMETDVLLNLAAAAREHLEILCGRRFLTQTWDLFLDSFPSGDIEIPYGPVQAVTAFAYTTSASVTTNWTVSGSDLQAGGVTQAHVIASDPDRRGLIRLADSATWPTATLKTADPIRIRFTCGYGATAISVPMPIQQAALLWIDQQYTGTNNMNAVHALIQHYRLP